MNVAEHMASSTNPVDLRLLQTYMMREAMNSNSVTKFGYQNDLLLLTKKSLHNKRPSGNTSSPSSNIMLQKITEDGSCEVPCFDPVVQEVIDTSGKNKQKHKRV